MTSNFLMLNVEKIKLLLIDPAELCNACTPFTVQWVIGSWRHKTLSRGVIAVERLGKGPHSSLWPPALLLSG